MCKPDRGRFAFTTRNKTLQIDPKNITTRYLLGELSEEEMSDLEARYFTQPAAFDEVLAAEAELIDGYSRNELPAGLRARFEKSYMADPTRRERVRFGEALAARIDREVSKPAPTPRSQGWLEFLRGPRPVLRLSAAFALLVLTIGGIWHLIRPAGRSEVAQGPAANTEPAPLPAKSVEQVLPIGSKPSLAPGVPIATPTPKPSPTRQVENVPRSVSLAIAMSGVRGDDSGKTPVLTIPRGTAEARLLVRLEDDSYPSYRLSLRAESAGAEIAGRSIERPRSGAGLVIAVPAAKLPDGDYIITLTGISADKSADDLSRSLFRVRRGN